MSFGSPMDTDPWPLLARRCLLHVMNRATAENMETLKAHLQRTAAAVSCQTHAPNPDEDTQRKSSRAFVAAAVSHIFPKLSSPLEGLYRGLYVQFLHVLEDHLRPTHANGEAERKWFRALLLSTSLEALFGGGNKPRWAKGAEDAHRRAAAELVAWLMIEGFLTESVVLAEVVRPLLGIQSNRPKDYNNPTDKSRFGGRQETERLGGGKPVCVRDAGDLDALLALFAVLATRAEVHIHDANTETERHAGREEEMVSAKDLAGGALLQVVAEALEETQRAMRRTGHTPHNAETGNKDIHEEEDEEEEEDVVTWPYRLVVLVELSIQRWERLRQHRCHHR